MEDKVTQTMGAIGDQNMEAKTTYMAKKKSKKEHPMKDKVVAAYTRYNGNLNLVCAQTMLPKHIVEEIMSDENI